MAVNVELDDDILTDAYRVTVKHYCYQVGDCTPKCKLFYLCQKSIALYSEFGEFDRWGMKDLQKAMCMINGKLVLTYGEYNHTVTANGVIKSKTNLIE